MDQIRTKLDKEVKQKWCDALRSGEYEQGKTFLKVKYKGEYKYRYCCLGVLCEILEDRLDLSVSKVNMEEGMSILFNENNTGLPKKVQEFTGLSKYGNIDEEDDEDSLASYNDSGEYTFDQIADIIEESF